MAYNRATTKMANVFANIKTKSVSVISKTDKIYGSYTELGEPYLLVPEEVESITIERNKFDKSANAMQQAGFMRGGTAMQMQFLFQRNTATRDEDVDDNAIKGYRVKVTFNEKSENPGDWFVSITRDMQHLFDEGKLKVGSELNVNQIAFQRYENRSIKKKIENGFDPKDLPAEEITLAFFDTESI